MLRCVGNVVALSPLDAWRGRVRPDLKKFSPDKSRMEELPAQTPEVWEDQELIKKWAERVEQSVGINGCWVWKGATCNGYGRLAHKGRDYATHRLSYEIHHKRKIAEGKFILHGCDNEPCCNPDHLREGTVKENSEDTRSRNRYSRKQPDRTPKAEDAIRRGYVVFDTPETYTLISEWDKQYHTLPKHNGVIPTGKITLENGNEVVISPILFNGSKLFSACREYEYDKDRKKRHYDAKKKP